MIREEQDLGVNTVHGWFTERNDSLQDGFLGEPSREKLRGD